MSKCYFCGSSNNVKLWCDDNDVMNDKLTCIYCRHSELRLCNFYFIIFGITVFLYFSLQRLI